MRFETTSITGSQLIVIPISSGFASGITLTNVLYETLMNKCIKYKNYYERAQQTINTSDRLYRKGLQDKIFNKKEYESICNVSR